jgi:hypothetical protein
MNNLRRCRRNFSPEQGFTLPVVMGMGSVMVLVAVALISRAQHSQTLASLQMRSEAATNAAEIGVTRLQSYLSQQRLLATKNLRAWPALAAEINNAVGSCPALPFQEAWTVGQKYAQGQWLETGAAHQQYRLVGYTYQSQPGINGQVGVATMTVEGRVTSGLTPAVSRVAVAIPIAIPSTQPAPPALWVKSLQLSENAQITGNVQTSRCPDLTDVDRVPGITSSNIAPGTQSQPTGIINAAPHPRWPQPKLIPTSARSIPVIRDNIALPRPYDLPDAQGEFHYVIEADTLNNSIQLPDGKKIAIQVAANQAVNLYTRGDIDLGGGQVTVQVIGDSQPHPEKLRIYGSDRTVKFSIKDSASVMATIQAPLAVGTGWAATGSGTGLTGILWLQQWDTATNHSRLPIKQKGTWTELGISPEDQLGLQLQPLSSWQRQGQ